MLAGCLAGCTNALLMEFIANISGARRAVRGATIRELRAVTCVERNADRSR